jgi:hypothetical protein
MRKYILTFVIILLAIIYLYNKQENFYGLYDYYYDYDYYDYDYDYYDYYDYPIYYYPWYIYGGRTWSNPTYNRRFYKHRAHQTYPKIKNNKKTIGDKIRKSKL